MNPIPSKRHLEAIKRGKRAKTPPPDDLADEIEKIFEYAHSADRFICATIDGKECDCWVKRATAQILKLISEARIDECKWWKDTQHFGLATPAVDEHIADLTNKLKALETK